MCDRSLLTLDIFGESSDRAAFAHPALSSGAAVPGLVLVEEMGFIAVVPPGWGAELGAIGELHLSCEHSAEPKD